MSNGTTTTMEISAKTKSFSSISEGITLVEIHREKKILTILKLKPLTHEFDREWLLGGDGDRILAFIYHILDLLEVPCYYEIVSTLTDMIVDLKKRGATSELPHVERLEVLMFVVMPRFPGEEDDVDVNFAEAPASDEAVETHLETVVVENEGYCVICMDKTRSSWVGCGEEWLRNSGNCPVCRAVP